MRTGKVIRRNKEESCGKSQKESIFAQNVDRVIHFAKRVCFLKDLRFE